MIGTRSGLQGLPLTTATTGNPLRTSRTRWDLLGGRVTTSPPLPVLDKGLRSKLGGCSRASGNQAVTFWGWGQNHKVFLPWLSDQPQGCIWKAGPMAVWGVGLHLSGARVSTGMRVRSLSELLMAPAADGEWGRVLGVGKASCRPNLRTLLASPSLLLLLEVGAQQVPGCEWGEEQGGLLEPRGWGLAGM